MTLPEDPQKVEVSIDAVLGSLQRRISQLVLESAMAEAQIQKLTEEIVSLQAENSHLTQLLESAQANRLEDASPGLRAVAPE